MPAPRNAEGAPTERMRPRIVDLGAEPAAAQGLSRLEVLEDVVAEGEGLHHHARNVERPFVEVTFGRLSHSAVTMEIAIPFRIVRIGEVSISPFADLPVAL